METKQTQQLQQEWFDTVYAQNSQLWHATTIMLELMMKAGMPMSKQRMAKFALDEPETVGVYVLDLADAGITAQDVVTDSHDARRMLDFFPTSSELVKAMSELKVQRDPPWLIIDPVYVWQDGGVRCTRRKHALVHGREIFEDPDQCALANGVTKALPVRVSEEEKANLPSKQGSPHKMMDRLASKLAMPDDNPDGVKIVNGRVRMTVDKMRRVEQEIATKAAEARKLRADREAAAGQ